jgi:hypothetical protein
VAANSSACIPVTPPCATDSETELRAPTASSDRVCVPAALPFSFSAPTLGYLVGRPQVNGATATTSQQLMLLAQGASGTLSLSLGAAEEILAVSSPQLTAATIAATLLYTGGPNVYTGSRTLAVLLEVFDELGGIPLPTALGVRLRATGGTADGETTAVAACSSGATTGHCVATVTVLPSWFTSGQAQAFVVEPETLESGGGSGSSFAPVIASLLTVPQAQATPSASVVATLPQAILRPGDSAQIVVAGDAGVDTAINSWTVGVQVGDGLTVTGAVVPAAWEAERTGLGTDFAVVAAIRSQSQAPAPLTPETMVTFTVRLDAAWPSTTLESLAINVTVYDFFDEDRLEPLSGDTRPTMVDVHGARPLDSTGVVLAAPDAVAAVSLRPLRSQLVNTAPLTGENVATPLSLSVFRSSGEALGSGERAALSPICRSRSHVAVISVASNCSSAFADASLTVANPAAMVEVELAGAGLGGVNITGAAHLAVWAPSGMVQLTADDTMLQPVEGWTDGSGTVRYQRTALRALVNFTNGEDVRHNLDMAAALYSAGVLHLSDDNILTMEADVKHVYGGGVVLSGRAAGSASVTIATAATMNCTTITVVEAPAVAVLGIQADVLASVIASLSSDVGAFGQLGPRTAQASYSRQLVTEFAAGVVAARAWLSDGQSLPLNVIQPSEAASSPNENGLDAVLSLTDDATSVRLSSQGASVEALATGTASEVIVSWRNGNGTDALIAAGTAVVDVVLPPPTGAEILIDGAAGPGRVSRNGDAAQLYEAVSQALTINLLFEGGRRQNMTVDDRTSVVVTAGGDLVEIVAGGPTGLQVQGRNGSAPAGTATLSVTFAHVGQTASVSVQLVLGTALTAALRPLPAYTGSEHVNVDTLQRQGGTQVYEMATLEAVLTLSDTSVVSASAAVQATAAPGDIVELTRSSGASAFTVSRNAAGPFGTATITVELRGLAAAPLSLEVLDSAVAVGEVIDVDFPETFAGLQASATAAATAGVILANGRRLPRSYLFPASGGGPIVAGLLAFSINDDRVASIDASSGVATLLGNSATQTTLTVAALPAGGPNATALFSGNLLPAVGDVDMGAAAGLPLAYNAASMSVPVRLNFSSSIVERAAVEILITYDATRLRLTAVTLTNAYANIFAANPFTAGEVRLGGATQEPLVGILPVATLEFEPLSAGLANLGGRVLTLEDDSEVALAPANTSFVAGAIAVHIPSQDRRRRESARPVRVAPRRGARELAPSLRRRRQSCAAPPLGDTNGNCEFGIEDVVFQLRYVALRIRDPSHPDVTDVTAAQLASLDIDASGRATPLDADFLNRAYFDLFNFVADVTVTDVATAADCVFSVSVELQTASGAAPDPSSAFVWVLLQAVNDSSVDLAAELGSSAFEAGGVLATTGSGAGPGEGVFLEAVHAGADSGVYEVRFSSLLTPARLGVSVVQGLIPPAGSPGGGQVQLGPLLAATAAPQALPGAQRWTATVNGEEISIATGGYSPLRETAGPAETSLVCRQRITCDENMEYEAVAATLAMDPVCLPLTVCTAEQFQLAAPNATTDRICQNASVCVEGLEYQVAPLTNVTDRQCATVTTCTNTQYQVTAPTAMSDRTCANATVCVTGEQFESRSLNATADRRCQAYTECLGDEWESRAPTEVSDRMCQAFTVCNATQFVLQAGSAMSDRLCARDLCVINNPCTAGANCTPTANLEAFCTCPVGVASCDTRDPIVEGSSEGANVGAIVGGIFGAVILILLLLLLLAAVRRRRNKNFRNTPAPGEEKDRIYGSPLYTSPMELEMQAMDNQVC